MEYLIIFIIFIALGWIIYFLPSIVANQRWSINKDLVLFLNIILGWTGIVWFILFFLAAGKTKKDVEREEAMIELLRNK